MVSLSVIFSAAVSLRSGCDVRSVGYVPACLDPSGIVSSSRLFILRSDLFLQGLTVRALDLRWVFAQFSSSKFLVPLRFLAMVTLEVLQSLDFFIIWMKSFFPCYGFLVFWALVWTSFSAPSRPPFCCPSDDHPGVGVFWISSALSLAEVLWP